MRLWAEIYRLRGWVRDLFYHRVIIKALEDEVKYTERNARDIINLIGEEHLRMESKPRTAHFGNIITLKQSFGAIQGACYSDSVIPPLYKIEMIVRDIKNYDKKKAGEK